MSTTWKDFEKVKLSIVVGKAAALLEQEEATNLPYIYLSAGVSAKLFQETLDLLCIRCQLQRCSCGRATWAGSVGLYIKDGAAAVNGFCTEGRQNIEELNAVLAKVATHLDRTRVRNKRYCLPKKQYRLRNIEGRNSSNVLRYFKRFIFIKKCFQNLCPIIRFTK